MASSNNNFHALLPKLNGNNYHHWSVQLKVLFESQDLWGIVENGINESANQESKKMDRKALFIIYQVVDEVIFERISSSTSSKEAWDMLYRTYRGEDRVKIVRLQTLRCEFDNIKMKETESVEDFYNRVILLLNQMRLNGETIEDKRVVEKILRSLTGKFEYIVVAIEESKDLASLSLKNLLGILQSYELRMRNFDDTSSMEQAFHSRVQSKISSNDNDEGPSTKRRMQPRPFCEIQCYYCHKYGHTLKHCKKKQEDDQNIDAKLMKEDESKETENMFMTFETDDLVKNDMWKDLTGNDDLIVAVNKAIVEDWIDMED